jgi:hypothetical protein
MQKWEYRTVQVSSSSPISLHATPLPVMGLINGQNAIYNQSIHEIVSQLGGDRWELTGTLSTEEMFGNDLFFQRSFVETIQIDATP